MAKETNAYLEMRLIEWAEWYRDRADLGIGYRHYGAEYLILKSKGKVVRSTQQAALPAHEAAEEIALLVAELARSGTERQKMAEALHCDYFNEGADLLKARSLGIGQSCFRNRVNAAKYWLEGRLSAKL